MGVVDRCTTSWRTVVMSINDYQSDAPLLLKVEKHQSSKGASHGSYRSFLVPAEPEMEQRNLLMEIYHTLSISVPVMLTYGSDYLVTIIQLIFVGHLGSVEMAGAALGTSFCNVTGFSVALGLLSALDTLTAQAYGAKKLDRVGAAVQQSVVALALVSVLVLPLWMFAGDVLVLLQQDPDAVEYAALYIRIVWFALFPTSLYSIMRSYMQNQNIVFPSMLTGFFNVIFSTVCLVVSMKYYNVGYIAVPVTQVLASIGCAGFMWIYILLFKLHKDTWVPFSFENLRGIGYWMRLAIPGMAMRCAEWWTFEINIIVAGLLSVEDLDAMTLLFNVINLLYTVPMGYSIAAAAKIGNAVGGENIALARRSSVLIVVLTLISQSFFACMLVGLKNHWPSLFINDEEVHDIIVSVVPLLGFFLIIDAFQTAMGGILRGCGKQAIGAVTYILAYYLVGMGVGLPLALIADMEVMGLWIGLTAASSACLVVLGGYFAFMSWDRVLDAARERLNAGEQIPDEDLE